MADTLVIDLDSLVCAKDNARPEGKSTKSRARSLWQPLPRPCLRQAREERLRLRVRTSTGSQRGSRTRSKPSPRPSRTRRTNANPRINTPRWISVGSQQRYREGSSDGRLAKCHSLGCLHLGHRRGQPHRRTQKCYTAGESIQDIDKDVTWAGEGATAPRPNRSPTGGADWRKANVKGTSIVSPNPRRRTTRASASRRGNSSVSTGSKAGLATTSTARSSSGT